MSALSLRPMSAQAFDAWQASAIADFAAEKVRAGNWPPEGARQRAAAEHAALLPEGIATPGHHFGEFLDPAGQAIGACWLHLRASGEGVAGPLVAWLYDFEIFAGWRGQGLGRPAMALIERLACELGAVRLDLHVFGHNRVARHLYEAAGFETTNLNMSKRLR